MLRDSQTIEQADVANDDETPPAADPVMSEKDLCDRIAIAQAGTSIQYHIGLLARDRDRLASALSPEDRVALDATADRAWKLAAAGLACLVQRRVANGRCAYLLIVCKRPVNARDPRSRLLPALLAEAA